MSDQQADKTKSQHAPRYSIANKAQAVALLDAGIKIDRVMEITGISKATIYRIRKIAQQRGYDPVTSRDFKDEYFVDAPRSGRPRKKPAAQTEAEQMEAEKMEPVE